MSYWNRPMPEKLRNEYKDFTVTERARSNYTFDDGHHLFVGIAFVVSEEEYVIFTSTHFWSLEDVWKAYVAALGISSVSQYPPFEVAIFDDESAQPLWSSREDEDESVRRKMRTLTKEEFDKTTDGRTCMKANIRGTSFEAEYDDYTYCWYQPPEPAESKYREENDLYDTPPHEPYGFPYYKDYPRSLLPGKLETKYLIDNYDEMGGHWGKNE